MSYRPHLNCRACGYGPAFDPGGIKNAASGDHLESILDLGVMPLPNAFKKTGESRPGHYPVELVVCPRCTLGQLSATVDPQVLYGHYPYVTSTSQTMREHFDALWRELNAEQKIDSVVEIGSNDGLCLEHFRKLGAGSVMGIDPAKNLVEEANKRGVNTLWCLFDRQAAEMANSSLPPLDLVLARHVFCHIDDWQGFINNLAVLCRKETLVCIEVPYAQEMIQKCEWDTIYAEHTSYLTIRAMQYLLEGSALRLQKILRFPIHGGAIALLLRRRDSEAVKDPTVNQFIDQERCGMEEWRHFADTALDQISNMKLLVRELKEQGKRIVGYGASAKSTVWVNACSFTRKHLDFITDTTHGKWYTTSPGTNIPILDDGALTRELPDYAICFCWNFREEVLRKETIFREKGGKWIFPTPKIEIV